MTLELLVKTHAQEGIFQNPMAISELHWRSLYRSRRQAAELRGRLNVALLPLPSPAAQIKGGGKGDRKRDCCRDPRYQDPASGQHAQR